jgi:protein TonB
LILAGLLALLLHAAVFAWKAPEGPVAPQAPDRQAKAFTVALVARRPAAVVSVPVNRPEKPAVRPVRKPAPERRPRLDTLPEPRSRPEPRPVQSPVPAAPPVPDRLQPEDTPLAAPEPARPEKEVPPDSAAPPAKAGLRSAPPGASAGGAPGPTPAPLVEAEPPRYGFRTEPEYPRLAVRRGYQGTTLLRVRILRDGSVAAVEIRESSGFQILDDAARDAVRTWRFSPALAAGSPVASWVLVPITFKLE